MEEGTWSPVPGPFTVPCVGGSQHCAADLVLGPRKTLLANMHLPFPTMQQNLMLALTIAIPLVTSLYILVNISYLLVLSPQEIVSSEAVAVSWG